MWKLFSFEYIHLIEHYSDYFPPDVVSVVTRVWSRTSSKGGGAMCPSQQFSEGHNLPPPPPSIYSNLCPGTSENWAFYIHHIPWILVLASLLIFWNLNKILFQKDFVWDEITFPCFFFFWNTIWSACKWLRTGIWRGHICSNHGNPVMARSRSDTG